MTKNGPLYGLIRAAVAQCLESNNQKVGGSIPTLVTQKTSELPCHSRGALEQGTVPPCSLGAVNGCLPPVPVCAQQLPTWMG